MKPEVYYGEGPFDPASSDEEADVLLEKSGRISPGSAERTSNSLQEDDHIVRSRRVCILSYKPQDLCYSQLRSITATVFASLLGDLPDLSYLYGDGYWYICCTLLYGDPFPYPRHPAYYYGSRLQWDILRTKTEHTVGT